MHRIGILGNDRHIGQNLSCGYFIGHRAEKTEQIEMAKSTYGQSLAFYQFIIIRLEHVLMGIDSVIGQQSVYIGNHFIEIVEDISCHILHQLCLIIIFFQIPAQGCIRCGLPMLCQTFRKSVSHFFSVQFLRFHSDICTNQHFPNPFLRRQGILFFFLHSRRYVQPITACGR